MTDFAIAQAPNQSGTHAARQGGDMQANPGLAGQPGEDDRTLEIAPQPGAVEPRPSVNEIPSDRGFRPGDENSSIEPSFRQSPDRGGEMRDRRRPYLGLSVRYATQCYMGMEEHGLEVVSVDPNSPAERAGLKSATGMTAAGAAGTTAGTMLGPLSLLVTPLLAKGGALGQGGDLIVAVDDRRVRSQGDLDDAMARLKPGDTMYLTVIRPVGNAHKTMKIAVKVGAVGEPIANAAPPSASASSGGESFTH
ncbi:MAG: PDZ domain-containing protein [Candidatus Binatus sp.]|uniref:PDZ domain-containing protein n=1 Tax=Candidatus Binatus sp. TaxID=2811406 RepID=UPI002715B932|nr:PDZ domain-containing protein [Candidatus Binatus sp.]MDO8433529.1 PDZ domain-containing protein [Candidatus Binatus sp.]